MKVHVIVLIISSCLLSCNSDDDSELVANPSFEQLDFPVSVGNYWEYKVTKEWVNEIDTLLIQVISKSDSAGIDNYLCTLTLGGVVVDSAYINVDSNLLVYSSFDSYSTFFADFKLEFPFDEGDVWDGFTLWDSVTVVSKTENLVMNGITYGPVYELERNIPASAVVYLLNQKFSVAPKIGIINHRILQFTGFSLEDRHFELTDYHVN